MRVFNRLRAGSTEPAARAETPAGTASRLYFGEFVLDNDRRQLWKGSEPIELPELTYLLLRTLLQRAPHVVPKDDLIREAWSGGVATDETLAQRIKLLRQSIGDDGKNPRYIAAVRGRGYRMLCPVHTGVARKRSWRVAAAVVTALLAAAWYFVAAVDSTTSGQRVQSLAVLPFADLSSGESRQYFADGLQEELLARLSQLAGVDVVSRTSVERYRQTSLPVSTIAMSLDVDAVVEGSAKIDGDRVRIAVQLVDGDTGRHVWSDTFDRKLNVSNIFAIQQEVAGQVARALEVEADLTSPGALPTDNLAAFDAYLLGRYHTFRQTPDDLELAIMHLRNAIRIDPQFAEAWATLGWAWSFMGTSYGSRKPGEVFPLAKDAALKALALDGNLGNAHSLYADILTWYDRDFAAAERSYRRAMELDPLDVLGYALFLSIQGRHDESIELIERRLSAHPSDVYVQVNAAWLYLSAGLYEQALRAAELADGHPDAEAAAGFTYLGMQQFELAVEAFRRAIERHGRNPLRIANLAVAQYAHGETEAADLLLKELQATESYVAPSTLATVMFAAGDVEQGFEYLAEAVRERDRGALFVLTGPALTTHRQTPEFRESAALAGLDLGVEPN